MQAVVDILKLAVRPTSVTFFIGLLGVGVALAFVRRTARLARWYFVAVFLSLWMLTAPACAERLVAWRAGAIPTLATAADARGAAVVVVLGAGNMTFQARGLTLSEITWNGVFRVLEGARLYRLLDKPTIVVSGGVTGRDAGARPEAEAMRDAMLELGVPPDHIVLETESKNTREEAIIIARMLAGRASQRIVLVTSPTHMPRSLAVFRAAGLDPIPSAAAYKSDHSLERLRWLPSDAGLVLLDSVVYDTAATWYYKARGWIPR